MNSSQRFVRFLPLAALLIVLFLFLRSLALLSAPAPVDHAPGITYLGEGEAEYSFGPGHTFIIKRPPFRFDAVNTEVYQARAGERVWLASGVDAAPPAQYRDVRLIGAVDAGCEITFTILDDDVDGRLNRFLIDGVPVYQTGEGMVVHGSFLAPVAGLLAFEALDSVGAYIHECESISTLTPSPSPTPSDTPTLTPSPSPTITPTLTLTATATVTPTLTPPVVETLPATLTATPPLTPTTTATASPSPSATATATATALVPDPEQATPTPSPTPKQPRYPGCFILNFDVAGTTARRGWYWIEEEGGKVLALIMLEEGWQGSDWENWLEADLTFPAVYVRVFYAPTLAGERLQLPILNHAPGRAEGWLARGVCHAIEAAWP